ncbi:hypothetical protein PF007_g32501 [Phytophthora fragariae]|nr:hypothetical protein PF007_g32501 [Phytophthora fragariae]
MDGGRGAEVGERRLACEDMAASCETDGGRRTSDGQQTLAGSAGERCWTEPRRGWREATGVTSEPSVELTGTRSGRHRTATAVRVDCRLHEDRRPRLATAAALICVEEQR